MAANADAFSAAFGDVATSAPSKSGPANDAFSAAFSPAKTEPAKGEITSAIPTARELASRLSAGQGMTDAGLAALPKTAAEWRDAIAAAPNTTYGGLLPLATDNATGAVRFAMPGMLRDAATGALDLVQGPHNAQYGDPNAVTPEATNALMMVGPGAVARGTGKLIAQVVDNNLMRRMTGDVAPAGVPANSNALLAAPAATGASAPMAASGPPQIRMGLVQPNTTRFGGTVQPSNPLTAVPPSAPVAANPLAGAAQPAAQSAGAAASGSNMTPMGAAEIQAARSTGEIQRVLEPAKQGVDTTVYVPGTQPTEAEIAGSPSVSFAQKQNRQANGDPHVARDMANNDARVEYYENTAGTPTQVLRMREARDEQAGKDLKTAFGNKQPTDAQPVVDTINGILTDPRGAENSALQTYVAPFLKQLQKPDGTLKSDPETLYGIREEINRKLSKTAQAETPTLNHVTGELLQVKGALDEAIEQGAPGYKQYLDNYSSASRPIDAMEFLQENRPKLTNGKGVMTLGPFDRMMKDVVANRSAGGIHPAGSLTDDQMEVLHNLHADLKRMQNIDLSNPRGSDTSMLLQGAKAAGSLAAHGIANAISPVVGSIGVQMGKDALTQRSIKKATENFLFPSPKKYPPAGP